MKELIVIILKHTCLYPLLIKWLNRRAINIWREDGCPLPPPHAMKQWVVKKYSSQYNLHLFVETGTFHGDMVEAMRNTFDAVYSIELSQFYYEKAVRRFKSDNKVKILHGDSGKEIGNLMKEIKQPILFWLDGHCSEGLTAKGEKYTPILEELQHILNHKNDRHVVLIDDARLFGSDPGYPNMEELYQFIFRQKNRVVISIEYDCICLTPNLK